MTFEPSRELTLGSPSRSIQAVKRVAKLLRRANPQHLQRTEFGVRAVFGTSSLVQLDCRLEAIDRTLDAF